MFSGRLGGDEQNELLEHTRRCDSCEGLYLRYLAAERAAVHDDEEQGARPTHFERERLAQRIMAQAAGQEQQAAGQVSVSRRWLMRALAWSTMALVTMLGGGVLWRALAPPRDDFTPKGGTAPATVGRRLLGAERRAQKR